MPSLSTRQEKVAFGALILCLIFLFVDQVYDTGFQKGHRGWCSANVMGIIERATPENGFVGYTMQYLEDDGSINYDYFDRYPVFFSVGMHVVLNTFTLSRGTQLYVARQVMNVLHAATLLFVVAMLVELELPLGIAIAAVALAASGRLLVSYRDMIHFDQAALLGFMGLLWAIARWYRTKDDRLAYIATALAVLSGRGYASFAVLGVWWIVEAVRSVRANPRLAFKQIALSVQTRACILSIALAASCLGYNIWMESRKQDVPIAEVGIIKSATKRLTMRTGFNEFETRSLSWSRFTGLQVSREVRNLRPFFMRDTNPKPDTGLFVVGMVALVVALFIASRKAQLRAPFIVASLAGLAWIYPMRGLTAFHEFTTMFFLGLNVLFFTALLCRIPARFQALPAVLACACLMYSTHLRNEELRKREPVGRALTEDLARIDRKLKPGVPVRVDARKLVPGVPYALGFLLPEQLLQRHGKSRYTLTRSPTSKRIGVNVTPKNTTVFLYDAQATAKPARR